MARKDGKLCPRLVLAHFLLDCRRQARMHGKYPQAPLVLDPMVLDAEKYRNAGVKPDSSIRRAIEGMQIRLVSLENYRVMDSRGRYSRLSDRLWSPSVSAEDARFDDAYIDAFDVFCPDAIVPSDKIDEFLSRLEPREERVIRLRYGIGVKWDHSLDEVGYLLDVGRERVRRIEVKAMRKLSLLILMFADQDTSIPETEKVLIREKISSIRKKEEEERVKKVKKSLLKMQNAIEKSYRITRQDKT